MSFRFYSKSNNRNNAVVALIIFAISISPFMLNLLGVNFSSKYIPLNTPDLYKDGHLNENILLPSLRAPILHSLLEWTSVLIAMLSVLLVLSYFKISKDTTTQIIGIALFFSGIADAFHTLSTLRITEAVVENKELMPFTWALARSFNICILLIGGIFALLANDSHNDLDPKYTPPNNEDEDIVKKYEFRTILLVCILFAVVAYIFNHLASTNPDLPNIIYPDSSVPRPLDLIPIVVSIFAMPVFIFLHRRINNCLTFALVMMLIPNIILEMHMAFRSYHLYDNDFNIAHILKIFSYTLPLMGVVAMHIQTYRSLEDAQNELENALDNLNQANEELEQFAYAASHDLQEPLRMISSFTSLLERDYAHLLDDTGKEYIEYATNAAQRMQELVVDLLAYSRLGHGAVQYDDVDCNTIMAIVIKNLTEQIYATKARIEVSYLPVIYGNRVNIMRVFQNIVGNALKYTRPGIEPIIRISCEEDEEKYTFRIQDNGIGFDPKHVDRIFKAFKRLHTQAKYPGTGIGLTMCKKVINAHGGKIWAESEIDKGTIFRFTIPKVNKQINKKNNNGREICNNNC